MEDCEARAKESDVGGALSGGSRCGRGLSSRLGGIRGAVPTMVAAVGETEAEVNADIGTQEPGRSENCPPPTT